MIELSRDRKLLNLVLRGRLAGDDSAVIIEDLKKSGYAAELSRRATEESFEYLLRSNAILTRKLKKLASLLGTRLVLQESQADLSVDIFKAQDLTVENFHSNYYSLNRPVRITNLDIWFDNLPAFSIENLLRKFREESIEVMSDRDEDPNYELNLDLHRRKTTLGGFLESLNSQPGNNQYLVANNFAFQTTGLSSLLSGLLPGPYFLDPDELRNRSMLWIGPAGTKTPLHHDRYNILFIQVEGKKRFHMADALALPFLHNRVGVFSDADLRTPNSTQQPIPSQVPILTFDVGPGEALFIPVFWWHQVEALEPSVSISLANFRYQNTFEIPDA